MLFYLILAFASVYFFVPLLLGWVLIATSLDGSKVQRLIGWAMVGLGAWGAVSGVPHWYHRASQNLATKNYMEDRCKHALVELPSARLPTEGIVLVQKSGNAFSSRIPRVEARDLINPARGLFQQVQVYREVGGGTNEMEEWAWQPGAVPEMGVPRPQTLTALTLPFELALESLTTPEDANHRIEGVEMKVIERATRTVVARQVLFAQWLDNPNSMSNEPSRRCPPVAPEERCNSVFDCDWAGPFLLRVLKPQTDLPESQLFHLHRGMSQSRRWSCAGDILVAPGISMADVEWWSAGRAHWEDLHLRIRGSPGELVCDNFHWGGATFRPTIRFGDGTAFPTVVVANAFKAKPSSSPRPLAELGR